MALPSNDDRLMAMVSHASVVIFGPGILVGLLIWLTQKERDSYASQQGLQAAMYQLLGMIVILVMWTLWGIFYTISWIPLVMNPEQFNDAPPPIFWIGLASVIIPLLVMLVWALYGLWGALKCFRGDDFRYLVIGNLLKSK